MNRGILQSLPVQQMVAGSPNCWNIKNMRPPASFFTQYTANPAESWNDSQEFPESWSQLLLGGLVDEEDKGGLSHMQPQKMENWEENSESGYTFGHHNLEFEALKPTFWPQIMPTSSPKSCVTTLSSNMLDFSCKSDRRRPQPDLPFECNSIATGGAAKKARIQSCSSQSTFKVRKEKLGDRITALHQLVSPFGKPDTASVLLEANGYIRFLQSQIEALSLPYLASGSGNLRQQHPVQGEGNCLFPEDPGQLLNDNCLKRLGTSGQNFHEEPKKDLRSRGLCLVPISCTPNVGNDNGADYWAPTHA